MIIIGCLWQSCEIGDLGYSELLRGLAEVIERRGSHAVVSKTKIDFIQVKLENFVLGIGALDTKREQRLAELPRKGSLLRQEKVLGDLLGDRRCALDMSIALNKDEERSKDALWINTRM